jgi:hypothetical protein
VERADRSEALTPSIGFVVARVDMYDRTGGGPMDDASRETSLGEHFVTEARQQLEASVSLIRHCLNQLDDSQVWWRPRNDMNIRALTTG